jgi:sugar lactone lactonase YvrE
VAVAADGTLYIVDGFLKIVDPAGNLTPDLTVGLLAVAVDGNGTVYFAQSGAVYRREANGAPATLLAGTLGQPGDDGDGGPATQAHFSIGTGGLAADKMGNLYISDFQAGRVRMFTPGGLITTVAGNGSQGFAGDDGPAAQAQISPAGIAFDAAGNLYIAEPANQRVRRVDTSGTITTFISNIGVTSLAVSPSGDVYGTAGNRIVTVKQ